MKERSAERVRAFLGAQILFNNNNLTIDCQIRNISSGGARLAVSANVALPEEFDLAVPQKGRNFRCRLRWRVDEAAGVEFIDADADADALKRRLRELEAENEALRREVASLQGRLVALACEPK